MKGEKALNGKLVRTTHTLFTRGLDVIPSGTVLIFARPDELRRPRPHSRWRHWETVISGVKRDDFEVIEKLPLSPPISPAEAAEFAHLVAAWATAEYELKRLSYGWQRRAADRWLRLAQLAEIATFPTSRKDLRDQARQAARESRDPKIKGTMRAGFRTLAWMLFRAARYDQER